MESFRCILKQGCWPKQDCLMRITSWSIYNYPLRQLFDQGFGVLKPYSPTIKPNLWSRYMHTILYPKNLTVTKLTYLVIKAFTGTPSRWRCQLTSNILNFLSPIHVVDLMSKWINDVISGKRTSLFHSFFLLRSYG